MNSQLFGASKITKPSTPAEDRMLPVSKPSLNSLFRAYCRREDGSLIIFSLFLFIVMIMFTGLALDLMNHHTRYTRVQSTMDRASLAAASLDQALDPEEVVREYFVKAGLADYELDVTVEEAYVGREEGADEGGELVSRQVSIETRLDTPTFIMHMMGTPVLKSPVAGAAKESIQNVEISLVLDVSGSMGSNNRLKNLKEATIEFIETVIDEERTEGITTMSIVPYNGYVVVPDEILNELDAGPETINALPPDPDDYPGVPEAILTGLNISYPDGHDISNCVRFRREGSAPSDRNDFNDTAITQSQRIERVAHFDEGGSSGYGYNEDMLPLGKSWCPVDDPTKSNDAHDRNKIMLPSADISDLQDKIRALRASGWTGVDNGVKWGAALLDPEFRPLFTNLIANNIMPAKLENRPNEYDEVETIKIIVVMTDGANTLQRDIKDKYKTGPSRIWRSINVAEASGNWYDGYFVEMPDNPEDSRWFQPKKPGDFSDGKYWATNELPDVAGWEDYTDAEKAKSMKQVDYIWLYNRFSEDDLANFFFRQQDTEAYNDHRSAVYNYSSYGDTDTRLSDICAAAKKHDGLIIYSIAFEAPAAGRAAMKDCATHDVDTYFEVTAANEISGAAGSTTIKDAFRAIAGQITQLRLTQ